MQRAESFAHTFEPLLATAQDGGNVATVASGLKAYVRKSPSEGLVVFLDNQGTSPVQTQIKLSNPTLQVPAGSTQLTVAANEIRPVVAGALWTANASLAYLATNVLGKLSLGSKTYYVCHGRSGESGEIAVQSPALPARSPPHPGPGTPRPRWRARPSPTRPAMASPSCPSTRAMALRPSSWC